MRICLCRGRVRPQLPRSNRTPLIWAQCGRTDGSDSTGPGLEDYLAYLYYVWGVKSGTVAPKEGGRGVGGSSQCFWGDWTVLCRDHRHKNIHGKLFGIAYQPFKFAKGRITLTWTQLQRKIWELVLLGVLGVVMLGIHSALWHVFQPSNVPLSGSLSRGTLGFKC